MNNMSAAKNESLSVKHGFLDNLQGQMFSIVMIAYGMSILHSLGIIMGQAAGIAFLISYATGYGFGPVFFFVNAPFYVLAAMRMGYVFTINTFIAVSGVSLLTSIASKYIAYSYLNPLVGAVFAGLCIGIGLIGLYRHNSSCGGISILAVLVQERTGFKAGWLQLSFDAVLFGMAFFYIPVQSIVYSLACAGSMSVLVALNHRKDWYVAR